MYLYVCVYSERERDWDLLQGIGSQTEKADKSHDLLSVSWRSKRADEHI